MKLSFRNSVAFYRSLLSCQRSRLLCSFYSFKWRNYSSDNAATGNETAKNTQVQKRGKEMTKDMFDISRAPRVDLTKSRGINVKHIKKETEYSLLLRHCLEESPNKEGFIKAVDVYINKNKTRRGHVDFIATAMKFIEPYGLEKEMEIYDKLMDVFPKDRFVNRSLLDAILPQIHPQMFLALDLLTKMEWQGLVPTQEMHDIVYAIFGRASLPLQKLYRMWFWFEEFKDINPYKLDENVYEDRMDIIRAAIDRILGNNDGTKILEISSPIKEEKESMINYDHFIVSSQTLLQKKYIDFCLPTNTIYIEGPTHIWINHKIEYYFIMKTGQMELVSSPGLEIDKDEEREGVIVGVCFATKPFTETLQRWLRYMQEENVGLRNVRVIFDVIDDVSGEKIKVISSS